MVVTGPIRILCVEDHPVFREGLRTIIGFEPDMVLVGARRQCSAGHRGVSYVIDPTSL